MQRVYYEGAEWAYKVGLGKDWGSLCPSEMGDVTLGINIANVLYGFK